MLQELPHLEAFVKLGAVLRDFCENPNGNKGVWTDNLNEVLLTAKAQNGWFTLENLNFALKQWGDCLTEENLTQWLGSYTIEPVKRPKTIAIIMAGNIPLVGFHDFISVLFSGNKVLAKLSDNDKVLLPYLTKFLIEQDASLSQKVEFSASKLENFDAIIATGSDNTSRYFEYYFGKYPNIIRKNRNSLAILTGGENQGQLKALGEDIFRYFGLGCRSVSKLLVPKDYEFDSLFEAIQEWDSLTENHKYNNNYDYNKAVYLMSDFKFLDTGYLLVKEDSLFSSPIATLNYSTYTSVNNLKTLLETNNESIQCVVSGGIFEDTVDFGQTQTPKLNDYADGIDTIDFLVNL
ncbi:acyl-CoA reductase [Croceivirga thetidis]|uniref:Acyl-CoA reductase n=1 Tax=Croceivirga thetidis TaxID=2721623 RepID=A0ABX1GRH5_9FLAO|nr:acyl-CoA reductase [Croceivirga thetidis]NKI32204.1 acyl-CoA reductase [Croceivirga thetidis]